MTEKVFTPASVQALKAPAKGRKEIFDGSVTGFGVRITGNGNKSWILCYRHKGKTRRITIGTVPKHYKNINGNETSLAVARTEAASLRTRIKDGEDPAVDKRAEAEKAAAEAADESRTFRAVVDTYFRRHRVRNTGTKLKRGDELKSIIEREVMPDWCDRKVTDIDRHDVAEKTGALMDAGTPGAANKLHEAIRQVFNYTVEHALVRGLDTAPTDRMKMPAPTVKRDRTLSDDEIRAIWKALGLTKAPFGPLYRLLLVTGQRLNETGRMKWSDVDLDARRWTIPAENAKNRRAHVVHLSDLAVEIIKAQPPVPYSEYVFAGRGANPASGHSKAKNALDELSEVTGWRVHDLRRTMRTGLGPLGVDVILAEKCLNHRIGGLVETYDRNPYEAEMREAWKGGRRICPRWSTRRTAPTSCGCQRKSRQPHHASRRPHRTTGRP